MDSSPELHAACRTKRRRKAPAIVALIVTLAVALAVAFAASWMNRGPDYAVMPMREVLTAILEAQEHNDQETIRAIRDASGQRDIATRLQELLALMEEPNVPLRRIAAEQLAADVMFAPFSGQRAEQAVAACAHQLRKLLDDDDDEVRRTVLTALVMMQLTQPWTAMPGDVVAAMRRQMKSPSWKSRGAVAWNLSLLGKASRPLAPDLLTMDTRAPESGLHEQVAAVFGSMQLRRPEIVQRLQQLLESDAPPVRCAAAKSLGSLGGIASSATSRLLSLVADPAQDIDVRRSALLALAELAAKDDATAALRHLLASEHDFAEREEAQQWVLAVGRLAARAPDVELTDVALNLLISKQASAEYFSEQAFACAIARIAHVRREGALLTDNITILQQALEAFDPHAWHFYPVTLPAVCETLIDLQLARPTLDIDMAAIRHVLEFAAKQNWRNPREWAEEQMDRLPQ